MRSKLLLLMLLSIPICVINSQTCCSGGIPLSNNIGLPFLEKGTFQIGLNYDYNYLNTLNNEDEKLDDNSRLRITHSILLNASYAVTSNLSVEGLFTWVNQRRKISQFGNENLDQTSGIGDGVLLAKYNFNDLIGGNSAFAIGVGVKVPLGSSTEQNDQGITYNADLQPGSNAWDLIYWSQYSKTFGFRPTFTVSGRVTYRDTGVNDSYFGDTTYQFGNELQAFLGFSDSFYILNTNSTPSITFKYRHANQDKVGGFNLDNTGGNWLMIIPDFSIYITPTIVFSTKAEIPIYSNVDGTQLTPTYRLTSGVFITIPTKKKIIINNTL